MIAGETSCAFNEVVTMSLVHVEQSVLVLILSVWSAHRAG